MVDTTPCRKFPSGGGLLRPRVESGWASRRGTTHDRNQDAVMAVAPFFAVADGVGGGAAGELASSHLLAYCQHISANEFRDPCRLAESLRQADAVLRTAMAAMVSGPSAATFVGLWLERTGEASLAHIGDARACLVERTRGSWTLQALTQDQTYAQMNEAPPLNGKPGDPARMVGVGVVGDPPVLRLRPREGEIVLLCSDGLHRFLTAEAIADIVGQGVETGAALDAIARVLADTAAGNGSYDDISVLLVRRNPMLGARQRFWIALTSAALLGLGVLALRTFNIVSW